MGDARSYAKALLNRLIDIGRSLGSDTDTSGNVIMEVEGDPDEIDKQAEDFSHPAIIYKPYISTVPSVEGALKPLLLRAGNELIVIGGREMRWQISVSDGEVVIRGLIENPGYIKFNADGDVEIHTSSGKIIDIDSNGDVVIGNGTSYAAARQTDAVSAATTMNTWISAVTTYINGIAPGTLTLPTDFGTITGGSGTVEIAD